MRARHARPGAPAGDSQGARVVVCCRHVLWCDDLVPPHPRLVSASQVGTARFVRSLVVHSASSIAPHAPALLKALTSGAFAERSSTVRKAYAAAAAQVGASRFHAPARPCRSLQRRPHRHDCRHERPHERSGRADTTPNAMERGMCGPEGPGRMHVCLVGTAYATTCTLACVGCRSPLVCEGVCRAELCTEWCLH